MPKKGSEPRKETRLRIPKMGIRYKETVREQESENYETEDSGFLRISRSSVVTFCEKCFEILVKICEKFHLVGFARAKTGEFVPFNQKGQMRHFAALVLCGALCMQKNWTTVQVFLYEELRMESFMCLTTLATINK